MLAPGKYMWDWKKQGTRFAPNAECPIEVELVKKSKSTLYFDDRPRSPVFHKNMNGHSVSGYCDDIYYGKWWDADDLFLKPCSVGHIKFKTEHIKIKEVHYPV